jgi:hypothetical protein
MKIAELLRALLDKVDHAEVIAAVPQHRDDLGNHAEPHDVEPSDNVEDPQDLFLPPLQMKLELLKKAVGVENVYDDGTDAEREQHEEVGAPGSEQDTGFEAELANIKKAAGLNTVVISDLADDEPLES